MSDELYRKHRPTAFADVYGQDEACAMLSGFIKSETLPHALIFTGPSGCGKTTLARILQKKLDVVDFDFHEKNSSDFRGIDTVRDIRGTYQLYASHGADSKKIYYLDECHQLTKDAQNAMLKMLEDTPDHVYFMLATTDPKKLIDPIITRCTEIRVKPLDPETMIHVMNDVLDKEEVKTRPEKDVLEAIANAAEGSARKALVILNQILKLKTKEEQLATVESSSISKEGESIARLLFRKDRFSWKEIATAIKASAEEPESIRWGVLGYANAILLSSGNPFAAAVMDVFQYNFYDTKKNGLTLACWKVFQMLNSKK